MINFMEKVSKAELLGIIDEAFGDRQELQLEEIIEHLLIRRAILMGVADAKAGRHLSVEEFDGRFRDGSLHYLAQQLREPAIESSLRA